MFEKMISIKGKSPGDSARKLADTIRKDSKKYGSYWEDELAMCGAGTVLYHAVEGKDEKVIAGYVKAVIMAAVILAFEDFAEEVKGKHEQDN